MSMPDPLRGLVERDDSHKPTDAEAAAALIADLIEDNQDVKMHLEVYLWGGVVESVSLKWDGGDGDDLPFHAIEGDPL